VFDRAAVAIAIYLLCASPAEAGTQLFEASWMVRAHGNERTGGTGESAFYSAFGIPQGIACNPNQPRCDFESTPTDGMYNFDPRGGCVPWYDFGGMGATMRPAKGETPTTGGKLKRPIPPLYRNPFFFTPSGKADRMACTAASTGATPGGKGSVQAGQPLTGKGVAQTTGTGTRGVQLAAAPSIGGSGIRGTRVGEFGVPYPYLYSYTYASLRNDAGLFGPGKGPGSFDIQYERGTNVVASISVKQGAAKFGGTMRMLGQLHTKVCYYRNGGCSHGYVNWLYDAIGAAAPTLSGVVTQGYQALGSAIYFHTGLGQINTVGIEGARFPWTTGSVTVTALGRGRRGPHKTVHYGQGYDNRTPTSGKGTIQLVSPTMTRWLLNPLNSWETAGIAVLRIKFLPEPRAWLMLAAGMSALALAYRLRR
jgi:hypothetical protein